MSAKDTSVTLPTSSEAGGRVPDPEAMGELDDSFFEHARVRQGRKVLREATGTFTRRGRPPKAAGQRKEAVSIRLSPDVLAFFRAGGEGWQTRIDEVLKAHIDPIEGANLLRSLTASGTTGGVRAKRSQIPTVVRDRATAQYRSAPAKDTRSRKAKARGETPER